jgi:hypothetical protein
MGFSARGFLPLFRWGLFNVRLQRLVSLHRRKPLENPDRRALGSPFDLVS